MTNQPRLRLARGAGSGPEIFLSFQGEGPMAGRRRAFLRLSGCNLACRWCDTAYTWNWSGLGHAHERDAPGRPHQFDPAAEVLGLSIAEAAQRVLDCGAEGLVVTGGEPLLQQPALEALFAALDAARPGLRLECETNGTLAPQPMLAARVDLFVVSPKLSHSGNAPHKALHEASLARFAGMEKAVFKWVAAGAADVAEAAALVRGFNIPSARVYVMPKGVTSADLHANGRAIRDAVLAAGFHFTDRLHIHLFGDERST